MDEPIGTTVLALSDEDTPGWMFCRGQVLKITDYPGLFDVIGNRFGGDGVIDFDLPNPGPITTCYEYSIRVSE